MEGDQQNRGEAEGDFTEHDSGDLSQQMFTREMDATIGEQAGQRLGDVERALAKIGEGSYGLPDESGEPVPTGRRAGGRAAGGRGGGAGEGRGRPLRPLRRRRAADTEGPAGGRAGGASDRGRAAEVRAAGAAAGPGPLPGVTSGPRRRAC